MANDNRPLVNQVALVTGANSGIGEGVAYAMADAGASVAVNYVVNPEAANKVVGNITSKGGKAIAVQADVGNEQQVQKMYDSIRSAFGTVDILVNNAGWQKDAPFAEMTLDKWNAVINVNLTGQFLCAREAVREFFRRGMRPVSRALGKIICMSSVHEVIPWGGHANYAASKGGVMLMMKSLAQELAPQKIRVNSIGPGAIQTPINRDAWETPEAMKSLLTLIPDGRIGQAEDIGRTAVFLASDASDYITGQTIFVDGGMTLYPGFATGG